MRFRHTYAAVALIAGFLMQDMTAAVAQPMGDEYDFAPRIRSYLQRPVSETEKYVEDVSAPSLSADEMSRQMSDLLPERNLMEMPEYMQVLIDKKIDPEKYIVGPGDVIGVYFWGELDVEYTSKVNPEGLLIIPTVGPANVADLTLAAAKDEFRRVASQKYKDLEMSVYLINPRRFRVYISGVVDNPGMYSANSLLRVSDLLYETQSGQMRADLSQMQMRQQLPLYNDKAGLYLRSERIANDQKRGSSKRLITITRDGEDIPVDLLIFEKTGDLDANPYVSGGDEIVIPPYNGDIMISGEVNDEGIYEFKPGDTLKDLVMFGGGLTALADTASSTLARFTPAGDQLQYIPVDLYDALMSNPDDPRFVLQESDRLFVNTKYNYKVLANVTVDGQVKFPGQFALIPNVTKLTDIIRMAGGFTEYANLEDARIIRQTTSATRDPEFERLQRTDPIAMTEEEYEYFRLRSRTPEGLIAIDFVKLFRDNDLSHDIYLEPDDDIFIPIRRDLVNVIGSVMEPGFIGWEANQPASFYIEKAGGYNWDARKRSVRIIKAKTRQRLRPGADVIIEGGDIVLIPEKQPVDWWQFFQDSTTVFANMATLVILASTLSKL